MFEVSNVREHQIFNGALRARVGFEICLFSVNLLLFFLFSSLYL